MLYVIYGIDAPGAGEMRSRTRPAHLARIKALKQAGRLELVGPMPNIDAPSLEAGVSGSLIVAEFGILQEARDWVDADPYREAGVYASVDVRPFLKVDPQ